MANQPPLMEEGEMQRLDVLLNCPPRQRFVSLLARLAWRTQCRLACHAKRALDVVLSLCILLIALPLMLLVAALIKLTDGGNILHWQTRVGRAGQPFAFPKFRSMVTHAEILQQALHAANQHGSHGITFKMRRDPRVTWIGRIIRKTSVDELPQLWCVLKGDMSLVGPRPALVQEVARYGLDDRRRLDAVPGITCIWQVSGRADIPFPEQVQLDVEYIKRQSLREDLRLLWKTIPAVITGRGAY